MLSKVFLTRFGPPHPVTPWEEELDVSGISHIKCTQVVVVMMVVMMMMVVVVVVMGEDGDDDLDAA